MRSENELRTEIEKILYLISDYDSPRKLNTSGMVATLMDGVIIGLTIALGESPTTTEMDAADAFYSLFGGVLDCL